MDPGIIPEVERILSRNVGFEHQPRLRWRDDVNYEVGELPFPVNLVPKHLAVDPPGSMGPTNKEVDLDEISSATIIRGKKNHAKFL